MGRCVNVINGFKSGVLGPILCTFNLDEGAKFVEVIPLCLGLGTLTNVSSIFLKVDFLCTFLGGLLGHLLQIRLTSFLFKTEAPAVLFQNTVLYANSKARQGIKDVSDFTGEYFGQILFQGKKFLGSTCDEQLQIDFVNLFVGLFVRTGYSFLFHAGDSGSNCSVSLVEALAQLIRVL